MTKSKLDKLIQKINKVSKLICDVQAILEGYSEILSDTKKLTEEQRSLSASIGGRARAKKLTSEKRRKIALKAAKTRWGHYKKRRG